MTARHILVYGQQGPKTFWNVSKAQTGEPELYVDENEAKSLTLDFADWLNGSETITAATIIEASNCTASVTLASPLVTITFSASVSYTYGRVVLNITSSSGEVLRQVIRVRRLNRYTDEVKYRDYT